MSGITDEIDKKIISFIEKNKSTLVYVEEIHEQTGIDEIIIQDRLKYLYSQKIITPKISVSCDNCYHMDIYIEEDKTDIFCKLLNKWFNFKTSQIRDVPSVCPLRTEKYYVEIIVEE